MKYEELREEYQIQCTIMEYNSLMSAIPSDWKKAACKSKGSEWQTPYGALIEKKKWSKITYKFFNSIHAPMEEITNKLAKSTGMPLEAHELSSAFTSINKYSDIVKYRSFQYRLLHNAVFLNNRLIHLGISDTHLCCQCESTKETTTHLFYECAKTSAIISSLKTYLIENEYAEANECKWDCKNVILSIVHINPFHCSNLLCTIMKQKYSQQNVKTRKRMAK